MKFKDYINESFMISYHGSSAKITSIEAKYMNEGNNQEGIGFYSGSLATAETYGKNIVQLEVNKSNYIDSRKDVCDFLSKRQRLLLFKDMFKSDKETMFYMITDWGVEIQEPNDIKTKHLEFMVEKMEFEEVRNFQIELANQFGVETLVESWNKHIKRIHGTYQEQGNGEIWFCTINTNIKVKGI